MNYPATLQSTWSGKRYNGFNRVLQDTFATRIYKVSLRLDFTCPNRDGTVAVGGCIYCNNAGHTPEAYRPRSSVTAQLRQGAEAVRKRHRAEKFIAFFQSYTNTYNPPAMLETLYREALAFPGVEGLAISTRPDCVPDEVLDLLAEISHDTYLWLEMGLESIHDRTLKWVNRGHGLLEFLDAVERCKARGLRVCAHLIFGFPGESREDMLAAAPLLNRLGIDGIKLHNLHVIKNTALEKIYNDCPFKILSKNEYVALVADFLELLSPEIVIHRLTGETYRSLTVAPEWSIDKLGVHNAITRILKERDTWQGRLFAANTGPNQVSALDSEGAQP
ncbi:MAG: TIGR01212 family radical SAM protein [Deltaproteobacteria bacterium]|nr:TIGR01212 family radical SAM protein [Deltaproteobacteria bacterium]